MKILITGGASGLGESITHYAARDSSNTVFFTYCKSGNEARKLEKAFPNTTAIKCDFKNDFEVNQLVESMVKLDLDVLVNNAYSGSFVNGYFHKTPQIEFAGEFKNNVLPTIVVTQAAITEFRKKKRGKIITVLTSALVGAPPLGASVYVANKAYLLGLTKVWAAENASFNITSNSVSPSFMETPFTARTDERLVEQMREKHPLKRLLRTDEVAETVLFLCAATTHLNGTDIAINAAMSIR